MEFLTRKWERELDYALRKELWAFTERPHRRPLPVRVAATPTGSGGGPTATSSGSSTPTGSCAAARPSINDVPIDEADRRIHGPRAPGDTTPLPIAIDRVLDAGDDN